ncbi:MAG: hypothetical protein ACP5D0_03025 [Hydrogenovibrio sp.]
MKFKSLLLTASLMLSMLVSATTAMASGYMPFILGSTSSDSLAVAVDKTKKSLTANGFEVVGHYQPNGDSEVLVVTNTALKTLAGLSTNGGFGAMERVSVVKRGDKVEVAYTNPTYMWNVYRMKGDIQPVQAAMEKALGKEKAFGADKPLTAGELREYHYKFMMPYFDDVDEIQSFDSYQEGVNTIEAGLKAGRGGATQVYRIDIPGKQMTVFGVALSQTEGSDKNILAQIDGAGHSHAAHLPYEVLVNGDKALALNGKFRIAINWPSLSMMGSGSFMSIANAPDGIMQSLEIVAGAD